MKQVTRRSFLYKTIGATTIAGFYNPDLRAGDTVSVDKKHFTILFQGDSITDGNRGRSDDPNHILGHGYAFSIASTLGSKYPSRNLSFINRGVSGNKITDLITRWTEDAIAHRPDLVSILVGINDIHAEIGQGNSLFEKDFETQYRRLLTETKQNLPEALVVIAEPFILPVGMVAKDPENWQHKVTTAQEIIRKLAKEFNTIFIPYQKMFDDACKRASADYWIWDGIHPTYSGHGLMASLWLDTVSKRCSLTSP
jgi:lysophospholipase L1-like esterase